MDVSFSKYDFQENGEQITGYSSSEINKTLLSYVIYNGIVIIKFKYYY